MCSSLFSRTSTGKTLNAENALWLFISTSLHSNVHTATAESSSAPNAQDALERAARQDFMSFHNQLDQTPDTDTTPGETAARKLSTLSSRSTRCISDQCNLALEWITHSLRQNTLLNQLSCLLGNEAQIQNFYRADAFLMERGYVEDFLNYIRAYELRDFSILSKVKRNFFDVQSQAVGSRDR